MKRTISLLAYWLAVSATPAFAEKVTIACSLPGRMVMHYTIDTDASTVTEYDVVPGTYPAQITDDAVTWVATNPKPEMVIPGGLTRASTYNRNTAQYLGWASEWAYYVPCVRAAPRPF